MVVVFLSPASKRETVSRDLNKGTETGDGFTDNQGVHFPRALVRVQRLCVGKEAGNLVVEQNAIATKDFTRPRHGLAHSHGTKGLRKGCMVVHELAFVLHLGKADHHALRSSDVP